MIKNKHFILYGLMIIMALAGSAVLWIAMPWGIGVGYDSVFYIKAADNLTSGQGLSIAGGDGSVKPLIHFPPLYSLSLAAFHILTGISTTFAAKLLTCIWFGLIVIIAGIIVHRYTHSAVAGLLASILAVTSPILVDVHLMAMSEPMFLVFLLLACLFLERYLDSQKRAALITAAVFTALAYLTRYVGASIVAVGGLAVLFLNRSRFTRRIVDAAIFGLVSVLPVGAWMVRNYLLTGSTTNRVFLYHPPTTAALQTGLQSLSTWILPTRIPDNLRLVLTILFLVVVAVLFIFWMLQTRRHSSDSETHRHILLSQILALFIALYVIFLFTSLFFFDASTPLSNRILSPVYLVGLLFTLIVVFNLLDRKWGSMIPVLLVVCGILLAGVNLYRSEKLLTDMRTEGNGFTGKRWQTSETIEFINQLAPGTFLVSNQAFPLYYCTGRPVLWLPEMTDPVKNLPNPNYSARLQQVQQMVADSNGALVILNPYTTGNTYPPLDMVTKGLVLLQKFSDGAVYVAPQNPLVKP